MARKEIDASATELWETLERRLCNTANYAALQDTFFNMKWMDRRESVAAYADRLRAASMALKKPVNHNVLLNLFRDGLTQSVQNQATFVVGDFDTVMSSVVRFYYAQPGAQRGSSRSKGRRKGR